MKCFRYPEYKTTDFKWLGEVPSHWGVGRTSRYFQIAMGETILQENLEEDGTWPVFSATDGDQYLGKVSSPRVKLFPGDIVIPARGNSIGAVKLVREAATTSQTTIYCKQISPEKFISEYIFFFMRGCRTNLFYFTQTAIPQITVGEVGANPILVPPILEQQAIVDFLDQETSKIDALISEQQRLIELLKEKRQAVISHAVTKGLNPDVPLKPSGVEWLGEVPVGWKVVPLGHLCESLSYGFTNPMPTADEGPFMLTANDIDYGRVKYDSARRTTFEAYSQELTSKSRPQKDDLLITKDGTLGRVALHDGRDACINQSVASVRVRRSELLPDFLAALLLAGAYQERMVFEAGGTTIKHIYISRLAKMPIAYPPLEEQKEISCWVSREGMSFNRLAAEAIRAVELLQERRTALISAAVTGKIDVRNYAATQKDAA